MGDPVKNFKNNRKKKTNPNDFYYRKGHDGETSNSSELIKAKNPNNSNIGNRNVYRFITPKDTTIVVYPEGQYYSTSSSPVAIYNNTSPNWSKLNNLFDIIKNSRKLDSYGTYFEDNKYIF